MDLLVTLASCCEQRGNYQLAAKKFTQAGDKLKAMQVAFFTLPGPDCICLLRKSELAVGSQHCTIHSFATGATQERRHGQDYLLRGKIPATQDLHPGGELPAGDDWRTTCSQLHLWFLRIAAMYAEQWLTVASLIRWGSRWTGTRTTARS